MANALFEDPRWAALYDVLEGVRSDLDAYEALVGEFQAGRVLDLGCGTGVLACRLAARGVDAIGVDPAQAMLNVAERRAGAERVRWVHGDVEAARRLGLAVDLVVMTGNVAQVFLEDREWDAVLTSCRDLLVGGGRLVFETRDPAAAAWRQWTRVRSETHHEVPDMGRIAAWHEWLTVAPGRVSFRTVVVREADGTRLTSESTLRFRSRAELERSIAQAGFTVEDVRDAPDRPGREWVFIARRPR
jgi:SAM-dependent methyltransferase